MPIFFTAFLRARDSRKWGKGTLENGKGTRKHFLCPLAIFQCPLAPFSAVSCLQEGCDNRTVENSTTCNKWALNLYIYHNSYICYFSKINFIENELLLSLITYFIFSVQFDLHIFLRCNCFSASSVQFDRISSSPHFFSLVRST